MHWILRGECRLRHVLSRLPLVVKPAWPGSDDREIQRKPVTARMQYVSDLLSEQQNSLGKGLPSGH
jgi:hypothetical protein